MVDFLDNYRFSAFSAKNVYKNVKNMKKLEKSIFKHVLLRSRKKIIKNVYKTFILWKNEANNIFHHVLILLKILKMSLRFD